MGKSLFLGLLVLPFAVCATDYYVNNQSGSDANDGRAADRAFATFAKATPNLKAGDRLHIAPGKTYHESIVIFNSGTAEQPVVIEGHGAVLSGLTPISSTDWQSLGNDLYFLKYENSFGNPQLTRGPVKEQIVNADRKGPEFLRGGEAIWRQGKGFYFRAEQGQTPADYDLHGFLVQGPVFHSGVFMDDKNFVTVRNLTCECFANDGFNVHHSSHGLLFRNVTGRYNGDDGFSVHEDVQACVYNGHFHHNDFGIQDVNASQTSFFACTVESNRTCGVDMWGGLRVFRGLTVKGNRCGQIRIRGAQAGHIGLADDDPLTRGHAFLSDVLVEGGGGQGLFVDPRAAVTARNLRIHDVESGLVVKGELYLVNFEVKNCRKTDCEVAEAKAFDVRTFDKK